MGLFTGPSSTTSRRPAQLKRRSLGQKKTDSSKVDWSPDGQTAATKAVPDISSSSTLQSHSNDPRASSVECAEQDQCAPPFVSLPASQFRPQDTRSAVSYSEQNHEKDIAEEPDLDLADLQSDNALLYHRLVPLDSALGIHAGAASLLELIDTHVAEHYLESFGIAHQDELVRHHNRLIPFVAKAPRFLSIHSLKRRDLDRDYTNVPDTSVTCVRKHLCLGR